jgi:DNA-directed RNA polymerase subunit omega
MLKPPISELLKKVDSRYTLVIAASKRARQIIEGSEKLIDIESNKPVTIATNEIIEDKITYERIESDI